MPITQAFAVGIPAPGVNLEEGREQGIRRTGPFLEPDYPSVGFKGSDVEFPVPFEKNRHPVFLFFDLPSAVARVMVILQSAIRSKNTRTSEILAGGSNPDDADLLGLSIAFIDLALPVSFYPIIELRRSWLRIESVSLAPPFPVLRARHFDWRRREDTKPPASEILAEKLLECHLSLFYSKDHFTDITPTIQASQQPAHSDG